MQRLFVLCLFILCVAVVLVDLGNADTSADPSVWKPSGTLYLDGHVYASFLKYNEGGSRFPHAREAFRQGFLMEAYKKFGLLPREEWLGDTFPEGKSDQPILTCRLDMEFQASDSASSDSGKKEQVLVTFVKETLQDSKDRDKEVCYYLGYQVEKEPGTQKPIIPQTVRQTGTFLKQAPLSFDAHDLSRSADEMYRLIRKEMLPALEKEARQNKAFQPSPLKQSEEAVPESIERLLRDMNFVSQYSAIRQLHHLEQKQGQSPLIMGALARGYANLSVLTNHYWHPVHNAFAGRAIWYAENLSQNGTVETSEAKEGHAANSISASLWRDSHLIYVYGILGYHAGTLRRIAQLEEERAKIDPAKRPTLPSWVPLIDAYCHYDVRKLRDKQISEPERELAALLYFFCIDEGNNVNEVSSCAGRVSEELTEVMPDCYRLYAVEGKGGLPGAQQLATLPAATLAKNLYNQVAKIPDVPEVVSKIAQIRSGKMATGFLLGDGSENDFQDRQNLYRTLLGTSATKNVAGKNKKEKEPKNQAVVSPSSANDFLVVDQNPLSWSTLGLMIRELSFQQVRYQTVFLAKAYGVPLPAKELENYSPLYEDHPYAHYLEATAVRDINERKELIIKLFEKWPPDNVFKASDNFYHVPRLYREIEHTMSDYHWVLWKVIAEDSRCVGGQVACACMNPCSRGFSISMRRLDQRSQAKVVKTFLKIVPYSPLARLYMIYYHRNEIQDQLDSWIEESHGFPGLLNLLGQQYWSENKTEEAIKCFKMANTETPQFKITLNLAGLYYAKEDFENWQKTLEELMENPGPGLNFARVNEALANGFMGRRQWKKALPYAQTAAQSYSAWGLLCAAKCYEALHEWEIAEKLYRACAMRYGNAAGVWMEYCLRTGKGDFQKAKQVMEQAAAVKKQTNPHNSDFCSVCEAYYMFHETDSFIRWREEESPTPWYYMLFFSIYNEKGDIPKRDKALKAAIDREHLIVPEHKNLMPQLNELMLLFEKDLAAGGKAEFSKEKLDHLLAISSDMERTNLYYFLGCYYDACGKRKEAVQAWKRCLASSRVNSIRCTQSGAQLHKRKIPVDDLDDVVKDLAKDEQRWKSIRHQHNATHSSSGKKN